MRDSATPDSVWTRIKRRKAVALAVVAACLFACGAMGYVFRPRESADAPPGSHRRMVKLLESIRERTAEENPFLGDAALSRLESRLADLPADTPDQDRFTLRLMLAGHALRLGRVDQARREIDTAERLLARAGERVSQEDRNSFLFHAALTYLRWGETENCVHCRNSQSCILPIQGDGIHQDRRGAEKACAYLERLLEEDPGHLAARWLLNLAKMAAGRYPDGVPAQFRIAPEAFASKERFPRFVNAAGRFGVDTLSLCGGAIVDDFNGDGRYDLVTSSWDTAGQLRFFTGTREGFTDATAHAGLKGIYGGLNLVHADYDNDGDNDLLVLRGAWLQEAGCHPNSLLQNDGTGKFRDVTFAAGLGPPHYPTQTAAWADYDNDGDLDLYVGNEAYPAQLFRNQGDGKFSDVAEQAGVAAAGYAKGVAWGDYNNDRWPDLYVSNKGQPNRLYRNNGDGTFTDVAHRLGVDEPVHSFPVWFWDFNNDGNLDLFVASYVEGIEHVAADYLGRSATVEHDCVYQGDGKGRFREVAAELGLRRVTQPMGCNFGDLDYDGFPDFYLGTGYPGYEGLMPNLMFLNRGGNRFAEVTFEGGFGHLQKGHGVAFADLDDDGDQDVFLQAGGFFPGDAAPDVLFENPGFGHHRIVVQLTGTRSNRSAIGARIEVQFTERGIRRNVFRWVGAGSSFGGNPLRQEIGVGAATKIEQLRVYWPTSNKSQSFGKLAVDVTVEIREGAAEYRTVGR